MTKTIHKYELTTIGQKSIIKIPSFSKLCDIKEQDGKICMWLMIDKNDKLIDQEYLIIGTGWDITDIKNKQFLKTIHMSNDLVWHVFWIIDDE